MRESDFLVEVGEGLAGVPIEAREAGRAVYEALHERMVFGQLVSTGSESRRVDELWRMPGMERLANFLGGVIPIELEEFLERVRVRAGLGTIGEARIAALAVFTALKRGLSKNRVEEVARSFSPGLRALWLEA